MIFFNFFVAFVAAFLTHLIAGKYKQGPVRASAILSFTFGLILLFLNEIFVIDSEELLRVFFGASFIGMCAPRWSYIQILVSVVSYTLIYYFIFPSLPHTAGALGLCAFCSVLISSLFTNKTYNLIFNKVK